MNIAAETTMDVDLKYDALLVKVNPAGPTCHTGARSCFHNPFHR